MNSQRCRSICMCLCVLFRKVPLPVRKEIIILSRARKIPLRTGVSDLTRSTRRPSRRETAKHNRVQTMSLDATSSLVTANSRGRKPLSRLSSKSAPGPLPRWDPVPRSGVYCCRNKSFGGAPRTTSAERRAQVLQDAHKLFR